MTFGEPMSGFVADGVALPPHAAKATITITITSATEQAATAFTRTSIKLLCLSFQPAPPFISALSQSDERIRRYPKCVTHAPVEKRMAGAAPGRAPSECQPLARWRVS